MAIQLLTAFFGAMGFALLWNSDKKCILPASFGGLLAWGIYILAHNFGNCGIFTAAFFAAAAAGLYSEIFARISKTPTTAFLIPALIPLFPGSSLYYAVSAAAVSDWKNLQLHGFSTIYFTLGIACGASIISSLLASFREIRKKRVKNS